MRVMQTHTIPAEEGLLLMTSGTVTSDDMRDRRTAAAAMVAARWCRVRARARGVSFWDTAKGESTGGALTGGALTGGAPTWMFAALPLN